MIDKTKLKSKSPLKLALGAICLAAALSATLGSNFQLTRVPTNGTEDKLQQEASHLHHHLPFSENLTTKAANEEKRDGVSAILWTISKARDSSQLPKMTSSYNPNDPNLLKACDNFFYNPDSLDGHYPIADFGLMALAAKAQSMVYSEIFIHKYDNFNDLKLAAGPDVNQEKCLRQLENLVERNNRLQVEKYRSKDLNLYQLLDTFGHMSSGLLLGNAFIEGMYHECLRLNIKIPNEMPSKTRYCLVRLKHKDWPQIDRFDVLKLKMGVCLPRACDSQNYKQKYELIWSLVESQLRELERDQAALDSVYCLPDEDSPLRSIFSSTSATVTLVALLLWISFLLYATYKHHKLGALEKGACRAGARGSHKERARAAWVSARKASDFGLTNGLSISKDNSDDGHEQVEESIMVKLFALLSITNNLSLLVNTSKESSLMEAGSKMGADAGAVAQPREQQQRPALKIVDLRCIEGIKVIAMCYVIMGHVLMCITSVMVNGREIASSTSMAFYLANLVPAFAVNSFFTITGILTTYLVFKQNQSHSFITSPTKWLAFIVYRYLRIMPMYALVVLYTKTLAKYTGSGPLWDYGTSALGQRKVCEQEPWAWTLLFASNFLPPLDHCIPAGWYLSNDFQFFLVTPLFIALLYKSPELGLTVVKLCIVAGYSAGFWSIFSKDNIDVRSIAKFAPNGFKTYIAQFSFNYTQPQYRIPAYLIGVLIGYKLFCFEREKLNYLERKQQQPDGSRTVETATAQQEPNWSEGFRKYAIPASLLVVFLCCITPLIGAQLPFTTTSARFMVALITPSYHVIFSLAIGIYILLATTGYGAKRLTNFLSASAWKPFARLSLCAVLINVEVINSIIQSNSNLHYISNQYHFAMNLICIVATYVVSVIVCVLFEAPIRGALNSILTLVMDKYVSKQKRIDTTKVRKID